MNAIDMLKRDHRKVEDIISSLQATLRNDTHSRQTLVGQLREELKIHEQLEEELLYPALLDHKQTHDLTQHSFEEHRKIDDILDELVDLDSHLDRWKLQLNALQSNLFHHIREEERKLFPLTKKVLGNERLEEMGLEMVEMKDKVMI